MRTSSKHMKDHGSRKTAEEGHDSQRNDAIDNDDDEGDDDWIIQQAEVWAAAEKESPSNPTEKKDTSDQKRSAALRKSPSESQTNNKTEQSKLGKIRKLQETEIGKTTATTTLPFNDEHLPSNQLQQGPQLYSLHLTQLSYDATDFDIREHFIKHGCMNIPSIRLVYDHPDTRGDGSKQKKFRGVAFVDIYMNTYDEYQALIQQLHGSNMLQRKINVRPVKSKVELASIVQQTKLYVNQQIQIEKEKKKVKLNATSVSGTDGVNAGKKTSDTLSQSESKNKWQKKKNSPKIKEPKSAKSSSNSVNDRNADSKANIAPGHTKKRKIESSATSSPQEKQKSTVVTKVKSDSTTSSSIHKSNSATKLTKQQRNRKAAILMQKRRAR